jgi:ABC-2 type transport system permease protein
LRTILDIIANDLRIFFGQRGNWVSLFLLPMAFTAVLGWALGRPGADAGGAVAPVDVVDLDGSATAARFVDRLTATNGTLLLCPMHNDGADGCGLDGESMPLSVDESIARVQEGSATALVVLPAGFGAAATGAGTARIDYYSLEDPTAPSPILQSVQTVVQELNSAGVAEYVGLALIDGLAAIAGEEGRMLFAESGTRENFADLYRRSLTQGMDDQPELVTFAATAPLADEGGLQGFEQAVPGMGTVFVMLTVLGGMSILLNERRQWTLQRTAVAPVSRAQILAGKGGAYFILGMVAFVLCITGLTFALAPRMKSETQASGLARLLSLTLAPLGGAWWPLAIVPPFMQTLGHLSPVAWAMDAFQELIWYGGGFGDILLELGVLTAAALALFGIGVASFRVDE